MAGFGAGTVATLVMHPLDLVKVRFQLAEAGPSRLPASTSTSTGTSTSAAGLSGPAAVGDVQKTKKPRLGRAVYDALRDAVRADGWRGLYRGLVPNLVGGATSWGLYFLL